MTASSLRLPIQGDLLVQTRRTLESLGYKTTDALKDKTGKTYAFKMQAPTGLPLCLVAKGSELMGDTISTQQELLGSWHGPLVFAWKRPDDLAASFYVFDPEAVLASKTYVNARPCAPDVPMVNYSLSLGKVWKIESSLGDVWTLLKKKRSASLMSFLVEKYRRPFPC